MGAVGEGASRGTSLPVDSAPRLPPPAVPLDDDELWALLLLRHLPGIGPVHLQTLLERHGSGQAALSRATPAELGARGAAERRAARHGHYATHALRAVRHGGITVVRRGEDGYPDDFNRVTLPPYLVYFRGRRELLSRPAVAIVGSRRHTQYGARSARSLASDVCRTGAVVVSGLARGVDSHAHLGALETGGTIAVLGTGIDVAFPPEHERLQARIAEEGLLLSEFDPGQPGLRHHFPQRNRLIAALVRAVVVVEAGPKSGALLTVGRAQELGRTILSVPGPIGRSTSAGSNALLQDGAVIVTCVEDILAHIGVESGRGDRRRDPRAPPATDGGEGRETQTGGDRRPEPAGLARVPLALWRRLEFEPLHVDELARAAGLKPATVLAGLLELELRGVARQLPGMRFMRV